MNQQRFAYPLPVSAFERSDNKKPLHGFFGTELTEFTEFYQ